MKMTFAPLDPLAASAAVKFLRLHTDTTGSVWYGADGSLGANSGCLVEEFFARAPSLGVELGAVEMIRLLGTASNAALVVQVHHQCLKLETDPRPRIQICSPALCPGPASRLAPELALQALWQPRSSGAAHWHDLSEKDYAAYALSAALEENQGQPNEKCLRILRYHPAWPALSFPAGFDPHYACLLAALIVDPRWFRDPLHPHRLSRLHAYLGVFPENARACNASGPQGRHFERFLTVLYAWCGRRSGCYGGGNYDPKNFLLQAGLRGQNRERGTLLATIRYLRFVVEVWLAGVCCAHQDGGFRPEQFFKTTGEVNGYRKHLAAVGDGRRL